MKIQMIVLCFILMCAFLWAQEDVAAEYGKQNYALKTLSEFKDSPEMIRVKLKQIETINSYRKAHNRQPVKLDLLASRVANMQSYYAAINDYSGHWDLNGYKPYIRYSLAGGRDHDSENASSQWGSGIPINGMQDSAESLKFMGNGLDSFMAEGPGGGHYENVLNPYHNYAGLGYFSTNIGSSYQVRYYEEYLDRYIEWGDFPFSAASGTDVTVSGKVIPGDTGVYAAAVYYESVPGKMTPSQINGMGGYSDYTSVVYKELWPWNISFDKSAGTFQIKLNFNKPGFYYVQIFLKKGLKAIPYDRPSSASTQGLVNASGVVIRVQ